MARSRLVGTIVVLATAVTLAQERGKEIVRVGPDAGLPFSPAVKAGGLIYVSGTLADRDGSISGDISAQTKTVLDKLAAVVEAAGSRMEQVASVFVYLRRQEDFAAMNAVYRTYWPAAPPVRTTVVTDLVLPDALVEISMIAIPDGGERQVVLPDGWMPSPNPYSYGIKSGNTLFLAGLVARDVRANRAIEGDITVQTKAVLDNAGEILKAAGMTHADVVASRVFLPDTATFREMNDAYRSYFPKDPPARATVRALLAGADYDVEISLVAVRDPSRRAIVTPNADGTPGRANPVLSSAIQVGNRLYLSGMLGSNDATRGDAGAQTREALARLGRTLQAAGFDWPHVVDGVVYLTDFANYATMNEAYREVLPRDFPARATVGTGLVSPDGLVEIMLTAVK